MANEERTEQATPRKRKDAREKGQVAKSMEINATLGLLATLLALKWLGPSLIAGWKELAAGNLSMIGHTSDLSIPVLQTAFIHSGGGFLRLVMPLLLVVMVTGIVSNVLQTGFIFSAKSLAFDFARLNPAQGITRMFSMRSATDLLKSTAKALVLGGVIYSFFRHHSTELTTLSTLDLQQLGPKLSSMCLDLLLKATMVLIVIAGLDYIFQRWQFEKTLRMTKQEVKEEYKRLEGDPQIKGRIRQKQREIAQRRMMSDVKKATVILTNPTHLAVALLYDPDNMAAPKVVAKGQRLIAQKIKELAKEHHIPVIENKPLARSLFAACEIGDVIPAELYEAVAEIIAFVFMQSGRSAATASQHALR